MMYSNFWRGFDVSWTLPSSDDVHEENAQRSLKYIRKETKAQKNNNFLAWRVGPRLDGQQCRCAKVFATPDDDGIHCIKAKSGKH